MELVGSIIGWFFFFFFLLRFFFGLLADDGLAASLSASLCGGPFKLRRGSPRISVAATSGERTPVERVVVKDCVPLGLSKDYVSLIHCNKQCHLLREGPLGFVAECEGGSPLRVRVVGVERFRLSFCFFSFLVVVWLSCRFSVLPAGAPGDSGNCVRVSSFLVDGSVLVD